MDTILQALDAVNGMFAEVNAKQPLTPAAPELLAALHHYSEPEAEGEVAPVVVQQPEPIKVVEPTPPTAAVAPSNLDNQDIDTITEDEFEQMLDELHGSKAPGQSTVPPVAAVSQPAAGMILPMMNLKHCLINCTVRAALKPNLLLKLQPKRMLQPQRLQVPVAMIYQMTSLKLYLMSCMVKVKHLSCQQPLLV